MTLRDVSDHKMIYILDTSKQVCFSSCRSDATILPYLHLGDLCGCQFVISLHRLTQKSVLSNL